MGLQARIHGYAVQPDGDKGMSYTAMAGSISYPKHRDVDASYMYDTEFGGIGKKIGAVLGVAASIAVPFLAAPIVSALGATGLASAAIYAGTGAALGAGTAALTGGNVGMGALTGAGAGLLGGGLKALGIGGGAAGAAGTTGAAGTAGTAGLSTGVTGAFVDQGVAGMLAPATGAAGAAFTPAVSNFLQTALTNAPKIVGTFMQLGSLNEQKAALDAVEAQMQNAYNTDKATYEKLKSVYDQLLAEAQNISPEFAQYVATKDAQRKAAAVERQLKEDVAAKQGTNEYSGIAERQRTLESVDLSRGLNAGLIAEQARADRMGTAAQYIGGLRNPDYDFMQSQLNLAGTRGELGNQRGELLGGLFGTMTPGLAGALQTKTDRAI